jgi:predicted DCC family thiol-disulfide oxidoreductase YuxK
MSATTGAIADRPSAAPPAATKRLTVLYDERCAFCLRCRDWLLGQPCLVDVELLPAGSAIAKQRYGSFPMLGDELVVFDDRGRGWVGAAAFLMCLWATARYRAWAYRFARPHLAPHAERFFRFVSKRRDRWNRWLDQDDDCSYCDEVAFRWGDA